MERKTNDSIFKTSTPSATSTLTKPKKCCETGNLEVPKFNMSTCSCNMSSLGILSMNSNISDITDYTKPTKYNQSIHSALQKQRDLANAQLNIPHKLNTLAISDEGVKQCKKSESHKNGSKPNPEATNSSIMFYKNLSLLSDELRSSDHSLRDLCKQYNMSTSNQTLDLSKEEFVNAKDLLNAGELSWKKQCDTPQEMSHFSKLSIATDTSVSMGKYFGERCENISDVLSMRKESMMQNTNPICLIDSTVHDYPVKEANVETSKKKIEESLSMSKIQRMLHDTKLSTTGICMDYLLGMKGNATQEHLDITSSQFSPIINSTVSEDLIRDMDVLKESSIQNESVLLSNSCSIYDISKNTSSRSNKENVPISCSCSKNPSPNKSPNTSRDSINNKNKSITSTRSASSLNTFADGKIPIRVSKTELIWGNLNIGKRQALNLIIKNTCDKRIHFMINLTGSNYRILKDAYSSDYLTSVNVVMHPLEAKPFTIIFNPVNIGACVEKLLLNSIGQQQIDKPESRYLKLYGYGGHVNLNFDGVHKESINSMRLNLGKLDYGNYLSKEIIINNIGNLCAFAMINVTAKDIHFLSKPQITSPKNIIIPPKGVNKITIVYTPTRSDLEYLKTTQLEVVQVCTLKIIYASEATRGRIRRLCNKLMETKNTIEPLVMKLSETFTNEAIPSDLNKFSESIAGMSDLLKQLTETEIILTLEQNLDTTIIGSVNESTMFQSLLDNGNETVLENTILNKPQESSVTIMPRNIILMPPKKCKDVIVLLSNLKKSINFYVRTEVANVNVLPNEGILIPNEKFFLTISCNRSCDLDNSNIYLHIGNEVIDINVKILHFN